MMANTNGGAGGSGVVVVRYKIGPIQKTKEHLVVLLVSMVVRQFTPSRPLVILMLITMAETTYC